MQENILIEGERLRLRRAEEKDFNYIFKIQYAPENLKFIVPLRRLSLTAQKK